MKRKTTIISPSIIQYYRETLLGHPKPGKNKSDRGVIMLAILGVLIAIFISCIAYSGGRLRGFREGVDYSDKLWREEMDSRGFIKKEYDNEQK